jgi:putative membrane protein
MPRGDAAVAGDSGGPFAGSALLETVAILGFGGLLWWLCARVPAALPAFAPWRFSWAAYLGTMFSLWWFGRGLRIIRIDPWRQAVFLGGVVLIYAVLQTRFDYWAQHMFFLNRTQHFVLQDLAPFLIALAAPGATLRAGLPGPPRRLARSAGLRRLTRWARQPVFAALLYLAIAAVWLIPAVQFRAMLDPVVYGVMQASMVISGLLFWCLVLDARPAPLAGIGRVTRLALALLIGFPMIGIGTMIGDTHHDLYPNYALCGRILPGISALADQQIGALIIWLPSGILSGIAVLLLAKRMFEEEDRLMLARGMTERLAGEKR